MMARRRAAVTGKTWAMRAAIGIAAGIVLGFIIGAVTVRILQPPAVLGSDSTADAGARKPPADAEPASEAPAQQDPAPAQNGTLVPKVIGMEEGDARNALLRAGFVIGSVTFKGSSAPIGTVVEAIPLPGEAVVLPATVSLILSDGKGRPDSLPAPPLR
ncbi:MAG: PASTA domain-containing protein [Phycisphaerae bacterium]|nr:PASTA domain-containing protein [Gemmatimonadaceae bacterium]